MESYIVRIYRSKADDPSGLVGVVEQVGVSGRQAFTNLDEMWEILNPKANGRLRSGSGRERSARKKS